MFLIKGSNWRLGVCDVVSTMIHHPYRNETVRLLLHYVCAIEVSFFIVSDSCWIHGIPKESGHTKKRPLHGTETEEKWNMKSYYQMSADEVRMQVNGKLAPLTEEEVKAHQEQYGKNELTEGKKKSTFQIFLEQFKDFLVIILIIAAIVSGFMGDVESAAVI